MVKPQELNTTTLLKSTSGLCLYPSRLNSLIREQTVAHVSEVRFAEVYFNAKSTVGTAISLEYLYFIHVIYIQTFICIVEDKIITCVTYPVTV